MYSALRWMLVPALQQPRGYGDDENGASWAHPRIVLLRLLAMERLGNGDSNNIHFI